MANKKIISLEDINKLQGRILSLIKKDIEIKLNCEYGFNSNKYTYDPDSSPLAWAYYLLVHEDKFKISIEQLSNGFDARMPRNCGFTKKGNPKRIIGSYRNIDIAGDCAFNFNDGKLIDFLKILYSNKANAKESIKELLLLCHLMHHSVFNFTLMPRTGGLNDVKGMKICDTQGFDRLDKFLAYMKSLFEKTDSKHEDLSNNKQILFIFLKEEVKTFNEYCKLFYHIDTNDNQEKYPKIKNLLENINKIEPISNCETLLNYIELAVEFWEHQADYYVKCTKKQNESSVKGDE